MITVEETKNEEYIKSVFLNQSIYQSMSDDSCPSMASDLTDSVAKAMAIPGFFLRGRIDGRDIGSWWLMWKGDKVEAHTALLPECRGRSAIDATKTAIKWVFENTTASAITSYAWSDSPAVAWFCRAVGMKFTRREKWPNTRRGRPVEISYYEIGRNS